MKNIVSLQDKTILVTGAAQGIGRAVAELALELGANVGVVDLNRDAIQSFAAEHGNRVMAFAGSVSDPEFATQSVQAAIERFGKVDGLVNNAGIVRPAMIEKMTLEQWRQVIDTHLTGSFLWLQAVGRHLLERAKAGEDAPGAIVNVSSDAGRKGSIGQINYASAKAGLLGMTMSAAREWAKYGIRTNTVCFGVVETPMTEVVRGEKFRAGALAQIPMGRWAQPEEVVKTICFLLSDASSYIIGQHIGVNGGYHLAS
ncbi:MAG: SDR family NAD(P)-dependent oxidoreductase [Ottowia sp.]|uniref:SDR family NAD(P)-dependent oxidoreductase n=1 Tax=unclassified Ottowia TaxID=2645081 RepID=UPI003C2D08EB